MFTPTFKLPWDFIGCGTPRIELVKHHTNWRACLFDFNADTATDGFDADTLDEIATIFSEAAEYIRKTDNHTPYLFEGVSNELQEEREPATGTVGPEHC